MELKEFASNLNGREYGMEISNKECDMAKAKGYVVLFGYSDDCAEFRGAIGDGISIYNGGQIFLDDDGILEKCHYECKHYEKALKRAKVINAVWDNGGYSWVYETDIPHETFDILENGEKYCRGIVFDIKSLQ